MGRLGFGQVSFPGSKWRTGSCLCGAYTESFLDGVQRLVGRVFSFLWGIRHLGRRLAITPECRRGPNRQEIMGLCRKHGAVAAGKPAPIPDLSSGAHPIALAT